VSRVTLTRLVILAGAAALLELLTRTGAINRLTLIPPSEMAAHLFEMLTAGALNAPMAETFADIALALALAASVGTIAGVVIHAHPRLRRLAEPLLASYYAVPFFVFYPLLIALFGLNRWPLVVIGFAFAVAAMMIATLNALDRIPPVLRKVAHVHRLSRTEELVQLQLPAAAPHLLAGLKLSLAYAFIGVIAGEFILSGSGLGHAIAYAYDSFDNATMYALMLFVLVLAIALNAVLHTFEQRLLRRRSRA
jgi:NitT/TauT family transport system permease protein